MADPSTNDSSPERLMETLLTKQLATKWKRRRNPRRLIDAYKLARQRKDSTAGIFLNQSDVFKGFAAWVAYHLSTPTKKGHRGHAHQTRIFDNFNELPLDTRRKVAECVANTNLDRTVELAIRRMANLCGITAGDPQPSPDFELSIQISSLNIREILPSVHNEDLGGDIHGTMRFPRVGTEKGLEDCMMSLELDWDLSLKLALGFFNTQVKADGDTRYLLLDSSAGVIPCPEMILTGAQEEALIRCLHPKIHDAISNSNKRKEELAKGYGTTRSKCVSMTLTNQASDRTRLILTLEARRAALLSKILQNQL